MSYDPKLREAAKEFESLCEKYDCIGICLFVSPMHAEFSSKINPSWSVMYMESQNELRFRSKLDDFPSKEKQHFATESTVHAVTSIVEWTRQTHGTWSYILKLLREHMTIIHQVWGKPDSVPGEEVGIE